MNKKSFAQKTVALALGATLALGIAPALAFASTTPEHSDGNNTAGPNLYVRQQEKDPNWLTAQDLPLDYFGPVSGDNGETPGVHDSYEEYLQRVQQRNAAVATTDQGGTSLTKDYDASRPQSRDNDDFADETEQGPTTHGYDASDPASDYQRQNADRPLTDFGPTSSDNGGHKPGVQG